MLNPFSEPKPGHTQCCRLNMSSGDAVFVVVVVVVVVAAAGSCKVTTILSEEKGGAMLNPWVGGMIDSNQQMLMSKIILDDTT